MACTGKGFCDSRCDAVGIGIQKIAVFRRTLWHTVQALSSGSGTIQTEARSPLQGGYVTCKSVVYLPDFRLRLRLL